MRHAEKLPVPALSGANYGAVEFDERDGTVWMIDQRSLPSNEDYWGATDYEQVAEAIERMVVRGAPAIGIAAAYGMALAVRGTRDIEQLRAEAKKAAERLQRTRPTAVNLAWAVERMLRVVEGLDSSDGAFERMVGEAKRIHLEDIESCKRIGQYGLELVPDGATVLTHCNAGALATGGFGTALGVVRAAHQAGKRVRVLADETRPYWQGARLTAWELLQDGIPVEVISDNMAGFYFSRGEVDLVITGADRVARNGDVANKIGTYAVACLAAWHDRPFYVAAPWSTVDTACHDGGEIPIEMRDGEELRRVGDRVLVPEGVPIRYPAFDVTPASMIAALVTDRGLIRQPDVEQIERLDGKEGDVPS